MTEKYTGRHRLATSGQASAELCNHTSVGILATRSGILQQAPPAGLLEPGESYPHAAARHLADKTGLGARTLQLRLAGIRHNQCRRIGGDHHRWEVFTADTFGEPQSRPEALSLWWANSRDLAELAARTRQLLDADAGPEVWQHEPGLEPVWLALLTELGWITP